MVKKMETNGIILKVLVVHHCVSIISVWKFIFSCECLFMFSIKYLFKFNVNFGKKIQKITDNRKCDHKDKYSYTQTPPLPTLQNEIVTRFNNLLKNQLRNVCNTNMST